MKNETYLSSVAVEFMPVVSVICQQSGKVATSDTVNETKEKEKPDR